MNYIEVMAELKAVLPKVKAKYETSKEETRTEFEDLKYLMEPGKKGESFMKKTFLIRSRK